MKKCILSTIIITSSLLATDTLTTKQGKSIVLNENFTWRFLETTAAEKTIPEFHYDQSGNTTIKSKDFPFAIRYNTDIYTVKQSKGDREFLFTSKDLTTYMMTIAENTLLDPDLLVEAAIINAKAMDPNLTVLDRGEAIMNGMPVKTLKMDVKSNNTDFIFYGFYFSTEETRTVQLVGWTYKSMFDKKKSDLERMFTGYQISHHLSK